LFLTVATTLSVTQTTESVTRLIIKIIKIIIIIIFYSDQDLIIAFTRSSSRCKSHSQWSAHQLLEYVKLHHFYSNGQVSFVHKITFYIPEDRHELHRKLQVSFLYSHMRNCVLPCHGKNQAHVHKTESC